MPLIREEIPDDRAAVAELNRMAFGGDCEAQLLGRLRSDGLVIVSLVALQDDEIVGHVMFSELVIESESGVIQAASLAPMAVTPKRQRRGIGSALVRRGLEICREHGQSIVVVVGHPEYYPRFGFSAELARNLHGPFSGKAWMALELVSGSLAGVRGTVRYPEAFGIVADPA